MPLKYNRHSDIISQIENEAIAFIWGYGIHKISRSQIMLPKSEGGLNMWDLHTKILALRATMIMKMIRAPCPEVRQLFEAVDLIGGPTLSYIPYMIRRNSTANSPIVFSLFEEIVASVKLIQTRDQNLPIDQVVWDSDVDGCPIGDVHGIVKSKKSDMDDFINIQWSDNTNTLEDSNSLLPISLDEQGVCRAFFENGLWVSVKGDEILHPTTLFSPVHEDDPKNCQVWSNFSLF